jgi:hypothetical protein
MRSAKQQDNCCRTDQTYMRAHVNVKVCLFEKSTAIQVALYAAIKHLESRIIMCSLSRNQPHFYKGFRLAFGERLIPRLSSIRAQKDSLDRWNVVGGKCAYTFCVIWYVHLCSRMHEVQALRILPQRGYDATDVTPGLV